MHNSTETRKALTPEELLLGSIQNGFPMVLLLGQDTSSQRFTLTPSLNWH